VWGCYAYVLTLAIDLFRTKRAAQLDELRDLVNYKEPKMALGDGIRRNIAHVEPAERAQLRDAMLELNQQFYPGSRTDSPSGGVSVWFKQDEIHQATHVHHGSEFLPWHREIVNRF
jgi:hypothetical protein